jgi:hypothetical protein
MESGLKKFHGTPIGGKRQDVARFLVGRDALVPFLRQDDMGAVGEFCRSFVFDNSAFSAWQRDVVIDFDEYVTWVERWHRHPGFEWALIPDVIDGDEAANDSYVRGWPRRYPGVPVWHLHESLGRLQRLCAEWPTVALGSSGQWATPGTVAWWHRMAEAMNVACDEQGRPKTKLHGLRMLDPAIFTALPLASADSTNAAVNCGAKSRFGMYPPATTAQCAEVIAERIEVQNSAPAWAGLPTQVDLFAA